MKHLTHYVIVFLQWHHFNGNTASFKEAYHTESSSLTLVFLSTWYESLSFRHEVIKLYLFSQLFKTVHHADRKLNRLEQIRNPLYMRYPQTCNLNEKNHFVQNSWMFMLCRDNRFFFSQHSNYPSLEGLWFHCSRGHGGRCFYSLILSLCRHEVEFAVGCSSGVEEAASEDKVAFPVKKR